MIKFGQIILGIILIILALMFIFSLVERKKKITVVTTILIFAYIFGNVFYYISLTYPY